MSKMKEVAALLGVEIGEEFEITEGNCSVYRITEQAMERKMKRKDGYLWVPSAGITLHDVLRGKEKIIKTPWKPKYGERYWCATTYCGASFREWQDKISDLVYYAIGNCFRTEEEAEAHKEEILARLEKIYDEGKPLICEDEWRDKE